MEVLKRLCCCFSRRRHRCLSGQRKRSSLIDKHLCSVKVNIARPYTPDPPYLAHDDGEEVDSVDSSVQQDERSGSHGETIITTRARFTYGLDEYQKNAMLIFGQTEPQGRELVDKRVELLKKTFGQFRFEVEAYFNLDPDQMEARLEEFFSKDFTGVGAVCVAAVGGAGAAGQLPAGALRCHESRVLSRLTSGLPGPLAGRPRVYITEVARTDAPSGAYSLPITSRYPDVIAVHIPVVIGGESNPLQMLCDRLGTERDLKAEVMAAVHEAETAFSALQHQPIIVDSTLMLELELVKRDNLADGANSAKVASVEEPDDVSEAKGSSQSHAKTQ